MRIKGMLFGLMALVFTGCAAIPEAPFNTLSWYQVGFQEGLNGYTAKWRSHYHMVQGGAPVDYDASAYKDGYQDGLKARCESGKCLGIALSR